jgi:hypothetical protein
MINPDLVDLLRRDSAIRERFIELARFAAAELETAASRSLLYSSQPPSSMAVVLAARADFLRELASLVSGEPEAASGERYTHPRPQLI